jgi:ankyrin repeat protein
MNGMWVAACDGDLAEVERLVGGDPGLLEASNGVGCTPLLLASACGHVGVVRWLLDKGAAIDQPTAHGQTALWYSCLGGRTPTVRLLLERGADPAIASHGGWTPLINASDRGHLGVVRVLLGRTSAKATINHRDDEGHTALWHACYWGRGEVARALLESGANPTIAKNDGTTPTVIAKRDPDHGCVSVEGRRECVAALEVRS